ncbi:MAG TPA: rhodanese-like domain-containing protein [Thermoanaerobaculia bacterium]|nr:rhodanese-like domain-containing protein [Thermoanaerobaculia bacterium]
MRKVALAVVALLTVFAAVLASAQYKQQKPATQKPASAPLVVPNAQANRGGTNFPRISIADALKLHKEGKAVFIDVRSNEQFSYGHIKGAMSIPGSQIVKRFAEVPTQKVVVTYCACDAEQSSGRAVNELLSHGVRNVFALKGGWNEWKRSGHPVAAGPK